MQLSVIIPTRNRSVLLARCLQSLTEQTVSCNHFEVLVIDNASIDETTSVCAGFREKLSNLRYCLEPSPGLHAGRHCGVKLSRGEILLFVDDDIKAFPTWLEGVSEAFEDPDVALVGGRVLPEYESPPPKWLDELWSGNSRGRWLGYLSLSDLGDVVREVAPSLVWGCNFSIRKSVLLECGGFHPDGMPQELVRFRGDGETAVSRCLKRKGYKAVHHPKASVHHWVPTARMQMDYLAQRAYLQGISDSYTCVRRSQGLSRADGVTIRLKHIRALVKERRKPIRLALFRAYRKGFLYHRKEVAGDPALLDWVLRETYIDG